MTKTTNRLVNGILLLNKPQDITSNKALQIVKRLYHAKKAGHTGSLDPLATGMLPICFGEATKFSQYLLDADKCYEVTAKLGQKTDTADSTGQVIAAVDSFDVSKVMLMDVLKRFVGPIQQIPSMYSALKHQGQPLYKLARAGIEVERKARTVVIDQLHLEAFDGHYFKLTVRCSKGTYIRNLIEDIGDALAVGAHVTQLHRLYTAGFENEPMYSIEELTQNSIEQLDAQLKPIDDMVKNLPALFLTPDETLFLRQGKRLAEQPRSGASGLARLYTSQGDAFLGVGEVSERGAIKAHKLLAYTSQDVQQSYG